MGYADRDYYRQGPVRPPSRLAGAPVVKWLLIINIAVFVIDLMLAPTVPRGYRGYNPGDLGVFGYFSLETAFQQYQVWRLLSFQFLHGGFLHLAFNMYAIFLFGRFAEQWWRSRPFLIFYLLCGIGGALFYALLFAVGMFPNATVATPLVGASAGIFGILIAVAVIAPEGRIMLLIPPIPMKMRTFALVFIGIETVLVLSHANNAGGSAGHLGGALVGFILMKTPVLRNLLMRLGTTTSRVSRPVLGRPPQRQKPRRRYEKKLRPKSSVTREDSSEIDRILDKINEHGLQSLTEEERELLTRAGKR